VPYLELENNKKYVLIGKTGSGKSTFFDLMNGLRSPQEGKITINNTETSEIMESWWKKNVFLLLQDSFIFRGTISDNILLDDIEKTADIEKLLADIGFADFFKRFSNGLNTSPKGGETLSGGERRIISILRLLLKPDYRMILIDEGKSGLDAELRNKIDKLMRKILENRLSITITHNLHEISNFDEVLFIHEGLLIKGNHEDLLLSNPDYAALIKEEQWLKQVNGE
jgi:ATP-binding cassette subfamily B protein